MPTYTIHAAKTNLSKLVARAEAGESLGVLDMYETAALAGGTLSISSTVDAGTTVRVEFPLAIE